MHDSIYILYPCNEHYKADCMYVGITSDVEMRIKGHVYSNTFYVGDKPCLNFAYQVIDELDDADNPLVEYDYIDLFEKMGFELCNIKHKSEADGMRALNRLLTKFPVYKRSRAMDGHPFYKHGWENWTAFEHHGVEGRNE